MKTCKKCKKQKQIDEFYNGNNYYCKQCVKLSTAEYSARMRKGKLINAYKDSAALFRKGNIKMYRITCKTCHKNKWARYFQNKTHAYSGKRTVCRVCVVKCRNQKYMSAKGPEFARDQKRKRLIREAKGLCAFCNFKCLRNSDRWCIKHWFVRIAQRTFKDGRKWKDLFRLYMDQDCKCIYTGIELIPSLNMSLDHKLSKWSHPHRKLDINNVQWVERWANMAKSKMSHDEFVVFCKSIAARFPS